MLVLLSGKGSASLHYPSFTSFSATLVQKAGSEC